MNTRYQVLLPFHRGLCLFTPHHHSRCREGLRRGPAAPPAQPGDTKAAGHSPPRPSAPADPGRETSAVPFQLFPVGEEELPPLFRTAERSMQEKQQQSAARQRLAGSVRAVLSESSGEELPFLCPKHLRGRKLRAALPLGARCPLRSGIAEGHPPPQPPTQAVLDPALLPLFHRCDFVWRFQHRNTAAPGKEPRDAARPRRHKSPGKRASTAGAPVPAHREQGI